MSPKIQFELMHQPTLDLLENANIPLAQAQEQAPDNRIDKEEFVGSDLLIGIQGYLEKNPSIAVTRETEEFLAREQSYFEPVGDMTRIVELLKFLTGPLHKAIMEHSATYKTILSRSSTFMTAMLAACAAYEDSKNGSEKKLDAALNRLVSEIEAGKDPLQLAQYEAVYNGMTSGGGRRIRRMIYSGCMEYFNGTAEKILWQDLTEVYIQART